MEKDNNNLRELAEKYRQEALKAFEEKDLVNTARLIQDAVHLFKVCGDDFSYARALNFLGVVYANMGDETMAVDYYLEGLECAKDKGLYAIISIFYNNIGSRYQELGQHKKAIFYFEKAMEAQQHEQALADEKYWYNVFVYVLNLAVSYQGLGDTKKAAYYLEETEKAMEKCGNTDFKLPVLVLKCGIYWDKGNKAFVKEHLDELLELSRGLNVVNDYVQNVQELALLLKKTEEYEGWRKLLEQVERETQQHKMNYYQLVSVEMWMEYYHTIGEFERYSDLCVKHALLYRKQKEIEDCERGQALDIRIALREKEEQRRAAENKAQTDTLTSLGNRYALENESKRLVQEAVLRDKLIAVGIIDIDYFKQINDTYGHNVGDECLKLLGDIFKNAVEGYGTVYRFGGDEFVVLIPEGDYEAAERIAERIQCRVEEACIENKNSVVTDKITISQGYACFRPYEGERLAGLLEHADAALYKVKDNGRNGYRIILEDL